MQHRSVAPGHWIRYAALAVAGLALLRLAPRMMMVKDNAAISAPLLLFAVLLFVQAAAPTGTRWHRLNIIRAGLVTFCAAPLLPPAFLRAWQAAPSWPLGAILAIAGWCMLCLIQVTLDFRLCGGTRLARLGYATGRLMPDFVRSLALVELRLLRAGLLQWRIQAQPPGALVFSIHKTGGDETLCWALVASTLIEMPVAHLILRHWSPRAAWISTELGALGLLYLLGLAKSLRQYPITLDDRFLLLRLGLALERRIDRSAIIKLEKMPAAAAHVQDDIRIARFWLMDPPVLALRHRTASGIEQVGFRVDEPARLIAALENQ